jgi:hypothetical protein
MGRADTLKIRLEIEATKYVASANSIATQPPQRHDGRVDHPPSSPLLEV